MGGGQMGGAASRYENLLEIASQLESFAQEASLQFLELGAWSVI